LSTATAVVLHHFPVTLGNQVASEGIDSSNIIDTNPRPMKGMDDRKTVPRLTSWGATAFNVYSSSPNGGEISPSWMLSREITPNQIGSYPKALA